MVLHILPHAWVSFIPPSQHTRIQGYFSIQQESSDVTTTGDVARTACLQYIPKVAVAVFTVFGGAFGTCAAFGADLRSAFRAMENAYVAAAEDVRSLTAGGAALRWCIHA